MPKPTKKPSEREPGPPKRYVYAFEVSTVVCLSAIDHHEVRQSSTYGMYDTAEKAVAARLDYINSPRREFEIQPLPDWAESYAHLYTDYQRWIVVKGKGDHYTEHLEIVRYEVQ